MRTKLKWRLGSFGWWTSFRPHSITTYSGDHHASQRITLGFGTVPKEYREDGFTIDGMGETIFVDLTQSEALTIVRFLVEELDTRKRAGERRRRHATR